MPLENLTEFLKLSSALNYNLSAASVNRYNVMMFIIAGKRLAQDDARDREHKAIVMEALAYLFDAYRDRRRRLGPMAVLHPLRTAAIMARSLERIDLIDLLAVLFHDVLEDIEAVHYGANEWKTLEGRMYELFERLDPEDEWRLNERLQALTRFASESYYQYIGRLLERSRVIPRLVEIKMADRLDNTPEHDRRARLRELALDAMRYCHEGRISMATRPDQRHMLDGLFSTHFAADERTVHAQRLDDLFGNKPLMIQASIAFIVIFTSFRSNPDFYVRGISTAGVEPE